MTDELAPFQSLATWYRAQCDGQWEHEYGVRIGTLDNPGWEVEIDLSQTSLQHATFTAVEVNESEHAWFTCRVEGTKFRAFCGPLLLATVVQVFVDWAGKAGEGVNEGSGST